jgi:hypothetical protein
MLVRLITFAAVASACSSPPPPPKAPPPPMKHNAPLEADIGGHHLVVRFADSPVADTSKAPPKIAAIDLDGATLFPRDCAAKSKSKLLACTNAHRNVKDAVEFHVVSQHVTEAQVQLLIAGRSSSNVDCGAHDYWVLRVDKSGASATEPAAGCFTMPSLDPDAQNPVVEWGNALTVRTFDEKSSSCALTLGPGAYTWKITRAKKP